jgi:hypothetical protein
MATVYAAYIIPIVSFRTALYVPTHAPTHIPTVSQGAECRHSLKRTTNVYMVKSKTIAFISESILRFTLLHCIYDFELVNDDSPLPLNSPKTPVIALTTNPEL